MYIFNIVVTAKYFSKFMLPLAIFENSECSTTLPILAFLDPLKNFQFSHHGECFIVILICMSLWQNDTEYLSLCFLMYLLWSIYIKVFLLDCLSFLTLISKGLLYFKCESFVEYMCYKERLSLWNERKILYKWK